MSDELRSKVERVLSEVWGGAPALGEAEALGSSKRSQVARFSVSANSGGGPRSVVVKRAALKEGEAYDLDAIYGPAWRLFNDWAGLEFLGEAAGLDSPAPRFYGGDRDAGWIVLEDLGQGPRLDQLLLGDEAAGAEEALLKLMTAVGRMHAKTAGRREEFERIRRRLGPLDVGRSPEDAVAIQKNKLGKFTRAFGLGAQTGDEGEWASLQRFLDPDGPFAAYCHNDPCPDNCVLAGDEVRLLDFEFARFQHALLDGVYGRMHFPTCWCVNRLPVRVYEEMERAYRRELARRCEAARDDGLFDRAVVEACAWQLLYSFNPAILEADEQWGLATLRQRAVVRLDRLAEVTAQRGHLEALGATARALAEAMRRQWAPEADEMPLYPAFR